MLFGVAGGMADWLDVDPAIVRIVWALLIFAGGAGLLLYIVAAIVIPEEPLGFASGPLPTSEAPVAGASAATGTTGPGEPVGVPPTGGAVPATGWVTPTAFPSRAAAREARRAERRATRGQRQGNGVVIFGLILVIVGGWLLLRMYFPLFDDRLVGPGFLVIIGVLILVSALNRPRRSPPS
jgi:phage shock protein C